MGKGRGVAVRRSVLDVVEGQFERFQRIWGRLYGASGARGAVQYGRGGIFVGAGVALAAVVLFVGRAERVRRGRQSVVGDVSGSESPEL